MDNRCERDEIKDGRGEKYERWYMDHGPHGRQLTSAELTAATEDYGLKEITLTETYFDSESGDVLNPRGPTVVIAAWSYHYHRSHIIV